MSDPRTLLITAGVAVLIVVALLLRRVWPVLLGRARGYDTAEMRLERWNTYLVPLLRKTLKGKMAVGIAGSFKSQEGGDDRSIATWSMTKSVLPDVDFVALARPGNGDEPPAVLGVATAKTLRELLGLDGFEQNLWGHTTWMYIWPDEADLEAVVKRLTPVGRFREQHGWAPEDMLPAGKKKSWMKSWMKRWWR